jgi:uncharacterized protein
MGTKHMRSLFIVILLTGLLSPSVFATPEEDYANAEKSFNEEDIKEATRFLRLSADQNYFPAQVRLGEFMYGSDDFEEAFGWYLTAAFQGDAAGQYHLGQMYGQGFGVDKSPDKAFFWIKKSAEQSYLAAVQLLADLYKPEEEITRKNILGLKPNKEQEDFWGAKLPDLEKIAAKITKKARAEDAKKRAAYDAKIKAEQSKLLCGLKC